VLCLICVFAQYDVQALFGAGQSDCDASKICTNGRVAVPRAGYEAKSNGCGSYGVNIDTGFNFTPCCDKHDECYGICGTAKSTCDKAFDKCLKKVCKQQTASAKASCESTASLFSLGTTALGCNAFLDAQREACECTTAARAKGLAAGVHVKEDF